MTGHFGPAAPTRRPYTSGTMHTENRTLNVWWKQQKRRLTLPERVDLTVKLVSTRVRSALFDAVERGAGREASPALTGEPREQEQIL